MNAYGSWSGLATDVLIPGYSGDCEESGAPSHPISLGSLLATLRSQAWLVLLEEEESKRHMEYSVFAGRQDSKARFCDVPDRHMSTNLLLMTRVDMTVPLGL